MYSITELGCQNGNTLRLLSLIDREEADLHANIEQDRKFGGHIHRKLFTSVKNTGIYLSCLYDNSLRFNVSFATDVSDPQVISALCELLHEAEEMHPSLEARFWFNAANASLIRGLRESLDLWEEPWEGFEFTADQPVPRIERPAGTDLRGYEASGLDCYLCLLEEAFIDIAEPNEFAGNRESMGRILADKEAAGEFHALWEGDDLLGLYYLEGKKIEMLGVRPKQQGRGYGAFLLRDAINRVLERKACCAAYLYCVASNWKATRFYSANGMRLSGHAMFVHRTRDNSKG